MGVVSGQWLVASGQWPVVGSQRGRRNTDRSNQSNPVKPSQTNQTRPNPVKPEKEQIRFLIVKSHSFSQIFVGLSLCAPRLCARKSESWNPNEVTAQIVDAAYEIHTGLGPGLLK